MKEWPLEVLIEAVLFTSGRSMKIEELAEELGYPVDEVTLSVSQLQQTVKRRRNSALQLVEVGGRFAFEVKPSIANHFTVNNKSRNTSKVTQSSRSHCLSPTDASISSG